MTDEGEAQSHGPSPRKYEQSFQRWKLGGEEGRQAVWQSQLNALTATCFLRHLGSQLYFISQPPLWLGVAT